MYYIKSYKDVDFDFEYSSVNDFSFSFKYNLKHKQRIFKVIDKIVKYNSIASKYIIDINTSIDKFIYIDLRINDLYSAPTCSSDILETELRKQSIYIELETIFKKFILSFHEKINKLNLVNKNTLIFFDNKIFKYNKNLFDKIYISTRDKKNIKLLSKIQLINYDNDFIYYTSFSNKYFELTSNTNRISTKIVKLDYKVEKNISVLKKYLMG